MRARAAGVGHIGSALSVVDLLAALYGRVLRIPAPDDNERDRFILSKGHAALALYAALHERGLIDRELLDLYCSARTTLGTHPEHEVSGIDFSTGSLGHGLSIGAGAALAARLQRSPRRVFVLVSDGECDEDSLWEAVMFAAQHRLGNLIALVDANGQQAFGYTRDVLDLSPLAERFRAFGWEAHDIAGHDPDALAALLDELRRRAGAAARARRRHDLRARRLVHGAADRLALLAARRRAVRARPRRPGRPRGRRARVRNAFATWLCDRAELDERVLLLTGDLGFTVLERFAERHPQRFFNVGVAEQNMVGLATGLAEAGLVPFAYSIATFATLRPYEHIRNGPVQHRLPVRIVGIGGGVDYGHNGVTHFALEDIALMRLQPELTTVVPADRRPDPRCAGRDRRDSTGRSICGSAAGGAVPGLAGAFALGRAELLADGSDVALVALGPMAHAALAAAEEPERRGSPPPSRSSARSTPSPEDELRELLARVPLALTVEAHYRSGGLGSLVAELAAGEALATRRAADRHRRDAARASPAARSARRALRPGPPRLSWPPRSPGWPPR